MNTTNTSNKKSVVTIAEGTLSAISTDGNQTYRFENTNIESPFVLVLNTSEMSDNIGNACRSRPARVSLELEWED